MTSKPEGTALPADHVFGTPTPLGGWNERAFRALLQKPTECGDLSLFPFSLGPDEFETALDHGAQARIVTLRDERASEHVMLTCQRY